MPTSASNPQPPFPTGRCPAKEPLDPVQILKFADRLGRPDENLSRIGAVALTESWAALCRAFAFPVDADPNEVVAWLKWQIVTPPASAALPLQDVDPTAAPSGPAQP